MYFSLKRSILAALFLGFFGCSTNPEVPNENVVSLGQNSYLENTKNIKDPALIAKAKKSAFHLFLILNQTQYEVVQRVFSTSKMMSHFPLILIQGDFYPLVSIDQGIEMGPWWYDLVRFETGALLLSQSLGFREYKMGQCFRSYRARIANKVPPNIESNVWNTTFKESNDIEAKINLIKSSEELDLIIKIRCDELAKAHLKEFLNLENHKAIILQIHKDNSLEIKILKNAQMSADQITNAHRAFLK